MTRRIASLTVGLMLVSSQAWAESWVLWTSVFQRATPPPLVRRRAGEEGRRVALPSRYRLRPDSISSYLALFGIGRV
jgi:hypothetical protein